MYLYEFNYKYLDLELSIETESVVFKNEKLLKRIQHTFENVVLFLVLPFIGASLFHHALELQKNIILSLIFLIACILLTFWLFHLKKKMKRLKRVYGLSPEINRQLIREIILEANWQVLVDKEMQFACCPRPLDSGDWLTQVIVIYDRDNLLINSLSFGNYGLVSPVNWHEDRRVERVIEYKFKQKLDKVKSEQLKTTNNI